MFDQRQQLTEMKKFMQISEGAWALPRNKEDFDKLAAILQSGDKNIKIHDQIYNVLGDDTLFDRLDKLDSQGNDAPEIIIQWMKDQRKDQYSNFPNIWNTYQLSQRHDSPMSEDERDEEEDTYVPSTNRPEERPHTPGYYNLGSGEQAAADSRAQAFIFDDIDEGGAVKHDDYGATPVYENDDECDRCCGLGTHPGRAGKKCPECNGTGKCPKSDDATPIQEDDPDGMGSYDIIWGDDTWKEAIPYDVAEKEVERILQMIDDSALQAHDDNDHLQVSKTADGSIMVWTVIDPIDGDTQIVKLVPSDMPAGYTGESISLESVVENVLQEYPGQPKDYDADEDDLGPIAQGKSGMVKDIGKELGIDVIDVPMNDYEQEKIDPEYEDTELGYRFD